MKPIIINLNPQKVKCKYCNKTKWDHHAGDLGCPEGLRTRIGHIRFSEVNFFEPKKNKKRK